MGVGRGALVLCSARSGFKVLGADPSKAMIAHAKDQDIRDLPIEFCVGDESVLRPGSYDAIVCSSVIEYVAEPDKLLQDFRNSLRGTGFLIISYSNKWSPYRLYLNLRRRKVVSRTRTNRAGAGRVLESC